MRKAITYIQSAHCLYPDITPEAITNVAGVIPSEVVEQFLKACFSNSFDQLQSAVTQVIADGYPVPALLVQVHSNLIDIKDLSSLNMGKIAQKLAEAEHCLTEGADEFLQLLNVASFLMTTLCYR